MNLDPENLPEPAENPADNAFGLPSSVIINIKKELGQGVSPIEIINTNMPTHAQSSLIGFINYFSGEGTINPEDVVVETKEKRRSRAAEMPESLYPEETISQPKRLSLWRQFVNWVKRTLRL